MAYGKDVPMNRLLDGVVAGFRVSEIKSFPVDSEAQDVQTGLIVKVKWSKLQVKLTHDASRPMSVKEPYAVAEVDPSHPLVLTLNAYLIPQQPLNGVARVPLGADKPPQNDKQRWAFIKYDVFKTILIHGGYKPGVGQRFPLPGVVYIEVALSNGNNYPREIGGEELINNKKESTNEFFSSLDSIVASADVSKSEDVQSLPGF